MDETHGRRRYSLVGVHVAEETGAVRTKVRVARIRVLGEVVGGQSVEVAGNRGVPVAMERMSEPPLVLGALGAVLRKGPRNDVRDGTTTGPIRIGPYSMAWLMYFSARGIAASIARSCQVSQCPPMFL